MAIKYRILPIGGGGGITPSGTLPITENGVYDVKQYQYADIGIDPPTPPVPDCLCFTATQQNSTVGMTHYGTNQSTTTPVLYYSTDGINFSQWDFSTITLANIGDKVYFYGDNPTGIGKNVTLFSSNGYSTFVINNGAVSLSGDITKLLDEHGMSSIPNSGLSYIFMGANIEGPVDLSTITDVGKSGMLKAFKGSSISSVDLSGLTIITHGRAFNECFNSCTNLTSVDLSNLERLEPSDDDGVFDGGFQGCTSLTSISLPKLTYVSRYGLQAFVRYCTSLTSINLPLLEHASGSGAIESLVEGCTSLTSLDLSSLKYYTTNSTCFYYMCKNCSSLSEIKIGITYYSSNSFNAWMQGVAATGDFYNLGGATIPTNSTNGIPSGWTEHTSL